MYPDWVLKHKIKGTNISQINGRYYLYECSSVWDKEKGRARKITGKYLGRITEDGLIPPKKRKITADVQQNPSVKTFGACSVLHEIGQDIINALGSIFTEECAAMIFVLALLRTIEHAPFKRMEHLYIHSYICELIPQLNLSSKNISGFLQQLGSQREKIVEFMKRFVEGSQYVLFDNTSITSLSKLMDINRVGYNSKGSYDPQINLLYIFACDSKAPVYYRIIPGNIRDVSAFKLSVVESGLKDAIVVADKGFASEKNFELMRELGLRYVVPLKRNSSFFDSSIASSGDKSKFQGYFMYKKRPIWYYKNADIIVYLDNDIKNEEEKDYLTRIEGDFEGYTMEGFIERQYKFGTIILRSNLNKTAEEIYLTYKERAEIEQSFDFLKNLMEQDKTYMQNERSLEAWGFINHIALILNYRVYRLLREKKLLNKYSVSDFFSHLKYIFKIKIGGEWHTSEISLKTQKLLNSLNLHIT